jgi:hypothetical protein
VAVGSRAAAVVVAEGVRGDVNRFRPWVARMP